jgi:hypothetical protein
VWKNEKRGNFHSCPGFLWCVYYVYMYTLKILGAGREGDESFFLKMKKKWKDRKWKIGDREGWLVDWRLIKGDESCESWGTETQFFGINDRKRVCNMCVKAEKGGFLTPVLGVKAVYTVCVYYVSCISWKKMASLDIKKCEIE